MHFILVDDNKIDLFYHERLIQNHGLASDISTYENPLEALESILSFKERPAAYGETVILLDIEMPQINGFEFVRRLAKAPMELQKKTHIFMVSGSLNVEESPLQADYLVVARLTKPLDAGELKEALAQIKK